MSDITAGVVEFDWLDGPDCRLLHYAAGLPTDHDETTWTGVRFACGQKVAWACIPGFPTRMTARRCGGCCAVVGLPRGVGSPKNDDACRRLLGLDIA